jgi:hypothetical protein
MIVGAVIGAALAAMAGPAVAAPGDVALMSRQGSSGTAGDHASVQPFATADGRDVAFLSAATNIGVAPITTTVDQAWVRSLVENANQLASAADGHGGAPADAAVTDVSVSDDGNLVAFHTQATNLVAAVTTAADRVYVRDLAAGTTTLVAANAVRPSISGDGRFVAFASHDNHDGATGVSTKVYVADLSAPGTFDLVSTDAGATLTGDYPRLSADGRYVAFVQQSQIAVRDRTQQTTETVSRATGADGTLQDSGPVGAYPAISRDGRYVTWATAASNLSPADTNGKLDVYERDRQTATTILASRADGMAGAVGDQASQTSTVSDDGRYVAFLSRATNFSTLDNTNGDNAYVRDVVAGTLTWVHGTPDQSGPNAPQGVMRGVSLSGDGAALFYDSNAHVLAEDSMTFSDVFRRELAGAGAPPAPPVLSVADAPAVAEGGPGATAAATFAVTLSAASAQPVSVHYATANGTATTDDYTPVAGTLVLEPGQATATITVPVTGDAAFEPDEAFTLALDTPAHATLGRATATATIANDDPAPPPPAPPAPKDHTLVGRVVYRPSYAPGADSGSAKGLAPSPYRAGFKVLLLDAAGQVLRSADVARADPRTAEPALIDFQMDGLGACHGCTARLGDRADDPAGDAVAVDFGGEAGQTVVELEAGRRGAGGRLEGTIAGPLSTSGAGFVVRVVRPGAKGAVLADSTKATVQCGRSAAAVKAGAAGAACPPATAFSYRLSGLPRDGSAVTVQLLQKGPKGDPVLVDAQDVALDASGTTQAPELTALDLVPTRALGRVLFGKIATLAPFAPGAVTSAELLPDPRDRPRVLLTDGGKVLKEATVTASTGALSRTGVRTPAGVSYSLDGLPACPKGCALELRVGKATRRFAVVVPERTPSVTRADLRYPATGTAEFLEGEVVTLARAAVRVKVTDAKSGKVLADSGTLPDPTCGRAARCAPRPTSSVEGTAPYRLGGLPADRDVRVTLSVAGRDVDSEAVTTAPEGQVTVVGPLSAPLSAAPGRVVAGTVVPARAFVPGGVAPVVDPRSLSGVRLVTAAGKVVATTKVTATRVAGRATGTGKASSAAGYAFQLSDVPACSDCLVELVEAGGAVGDRAPVDVGDAAPSVTTAQLHDGELTAGKWVTVSLKPSATVAPRDLRVTVAGPDGKLLADSAAPAFRSCARSGGCVPGTAFDYRLGGVPADVGTVTVTVFLRGRRAASDTVRFDAGSVEAASALLVRVPSSSAKP